MSGGQGAEYAGWIIGAIFGSLLGIFWTGDLLIGLLLTIICAFVGGAVGYAAWAVARR